MESVSPTEVEEGKTGTLHILAIQWWSVAHSIHRKMQQWTQVTLHTQEIQWWSQVHYRHTRCSGGHRYTLYTGDTVVVTGTLGTQEIQLWSQVRSLHSVTVVVTGVHSTQRRYSGSIKYTPYKGDTEVVTGTLNRRRDWWSQTHSTHWAHYVGHMDTPYTGDTIVLTGTLHTQETQR
jgi:hypothetical protein